MITNTLLTGMEMIKDHLGTSGILTHLRWRGTACGVPTLVLEGALRWHSHLSLPYHPTIPLAELFVQHPNPTGFVAQF